MIVIEANIFINNGNNLIFTACVVGVTKDKESLGSNTIFEEQVIPETSMVLKTIDFKNIGDPILYSLNALVMVAKKYHFNAKRVGHDGNNKFHIEFY